MSSKFCRSTDPKVGIIVIQSGSFCHLTLKVQISFRRNIFSSLFDQIFAHNWKSSDSRTNSAVSSLICQIVTLNSSFLQRAFTNLTQHFNKTEVAPVLEAGSLTLSFYFFLSISSSKLFSAETTNSPAGPQGVWYIHKTIYEISRQVPTSHSVLFGCMQKSFPAKVHIIYSKPCCDSSLFCHSEIQERLTSGLCTPTTSDLRLRAGLRRKSIRAYYEALPRAGCGNSHRRSMWRTSSRAGKTAGR